MGGKQTKVVVDTMETVRSISITVAEKSLITSLKGETKEATSWFSFF